MNWNLLGLVMAGGALGSAGRYLIGHYALMHWGNRMPWGTLTANLVGAFLAGFLLVWLEGRGPSALLWRAFLMVGMLGGLTTFSALMVESIISVRTERPDAMLLYLAVTVMGGLALVWAGARLADLLRA